MVATSLSCPLLGSMKTSKEGGKMEYIPSVDLGMLSPACMARHSYVRRERERNRQTRKEHVKIKKGRLFKLWVSKAS